MDSCDPEYATDAPTWLATLEAAGLSADELRAALVAAGWPAPEESGHIGRARMMHNIRQGYDITRVVRAETSYHQAYDGMEEYENRLQAERQRQVVTGTRPAARPWASGPQALRDRVEASPAVSSVSRPSPPRLTTVPRVTARAVSMVVPIKLAELEEGCQRALTLGGWTPEEIGWALRRAGAEWRDRKILACPEENRLVLFMALSKINMNTIMAAQVPRQPGYCPLDCVWWGPLF